MIWDWQLTEHWEAFNRLLARNITGLSIFNIQNNKWYSPVTSGRHLAMPKIRSRLANFLSLILLWCCCFYNSKDSFVSTFFARLSFVWLEEGSYKYIELKVSIGELGEIYEDGTTKVGEYLFLKIFFQVTLNFW